MGNSIRRISRLGPCFVALITLAGCVQGAMVEVSKQGEAITVTVTGRGSDPPCITTLAITRAGSDIKTTPALWEVSTADPANCRASFTYGDVPSGWSESGPAPKLAQGLKYGVDAIGIGTLGGGEFTMRAGDGVLTDP